MIIDCAHYKDGRRRDDATLSLPEAAARRAEGGFLWLGLFEPGESELAQVRQLFGLHELAVQDALTSHRRPKIESYREDLRLVVLRTARYDDDAEAMITVEQTKVGLQQNSIIERLTVLATIFLPLTFLTGFFGQNFGWLVDHTASFAAFLIYGIGGLALALTLLTLWLRRSTSKADTSAAASNPAG